MHKRLAINPRLVAAVFLMVFNLFYLQPLTNKVFAAGLDNRFNRLSNPLASASATYLVGFTYTNPVNPVGSISMQFCSNNPIPNSACTAPAGFDISTATLAAQSGNTGFSIDGATTINRLVLTRPSVAPLAVASTYQLNAAINPSTSGTYYIRLQTYSSTDGTGSDIEDGGIAYAISPALTVSATVPPTLTFCAAISIPVFNCASAVTFFLDMGDFTTQSPTAATSNLLVATNAGNGFSITMNGTTLTSGNNTIAALAAQTPSVPASSQFGINLRANTVPIIGTDPAGPGVGTVAAAYNIPNLFRFVNGDSIANSAGTTDWTRYTISYVTNISAAQAVGVYATTLSFICLANF